MACEVDDQGVDGVDEVQLVVDELDRDGVIGARTGTATVRRAGVSTGLGAAEVVTVLDEAGAEDGGLAGSPGTRTSGKYGPTKRRSSQVLTEPHSDHCNSSHSTPGCENESA